ncbi:MFS transporter [Candidatus Woesearchaeota archaeon]|nr:MFS transporter [Candidatus Woesearchaeota archaeon]
MNTKQKFAYWRKRILFTTWITYALFYFGRVNMSIAIPGIIEEFGISKTAIGVVLTALFTMYAVGQFINGQLGDKFGAKKIVSLGILASAIINIIFGFTNGILASMILLWGINGYVQSMGWAPTVKTVANWFPRQLRGRASGILGSSYIIGSAGSWALSGFLVGLLGWRWAFWVPGLILVLGGIHNFIRVRNAPEEAGLPTLEDHEKGLKESKAKSDYHLGFLHTIKSVLTRKRIWAAAFALFGLNIVRYGFLSWAPTFFFEVQGATISTAAYKAMIIPLAGSLGAICAGWMSDKVFKSRRAPIAMIMLILLAVCSLIYPILPAGRWMLSLVFLAAIGFLTYGPHVMIVASMPMDFGTRKAAASATGFIDGWGYIGAALTGVGTGFLIDNFGWHYSFYFWILGALGAAAIMAVLWKYGPVESKYH